MKYLFAVLVLAYYMTSASADTGYMTDEEAEKYCWYNKELD